MLDFRAMNRVQPLAENALARIVRFDHPSGHAAPLDPVERCDSYAVSFVERGHFALVQNRETISFQAGDVLLSYPGTFHRYAHPGECGDDVCLSVQFDSTLVQEQLDGDTGGRSKLTASARAAFLAWRIREALDGSDQAAVESATLEALSALLGQAQRWRALVCREPQFQLYARRVAEAQELLDQRFEDSLSLAGLARSVGMSVFHFHRVFRRLAGVTPHQYLLDRRLRHSRRLLQQGACVTEAAFGSGFGNLSHFCRTFKRRFGLRPSDCR